MPKTKHTLPEATTSKKRVLHIGAGKKIRRPLHPGFKTAEWEEILLDISPESEPDVIGDITNLQHIPDNALDAVYLPHFIERYYLPDAQKALSEFYRILSIGGQLVIATPDIREVAEAIIKKGLEQTLYESPAGPITPFDMLWGYRPAIAKGQFHHAHKCGFTAATLGLKLRSAGYRDITIKREKLTLWANAFKRDKKATEKERIRVLEEDVNEMIRKRDDIEKEPEAWKGYPPKKNQRENKKAEKETL